MLGIKFNACPETNMLKAFAITLLAATFMTSGIAFAPAGNAVKPGLMQTAVVAPGKTDREDYSKS